MSAHGPDERLSAFYDGELSAAERLEVERLLTESPDLRAELSGLSDLSQRLSDMADDLPAFDLRPELLQRLPSSSSTPPAPLAALTAPTRRRWMPMILAACSLSLLVAAILPLMPTPNSDSIVAISPSAAMVNSSPDGIASDLPMAAPMSPAAPMPDALPSAEVVMADSMKAEEANVGNGDSEDDLAAAEAEGAGPSEFLGALERSRGLKPGEIVTRLIESSDGLLLVEYIVVDITRGAEEVEVLLKQNGIVPLVAMDQTEISSTDSPAKSSRTELPLKVILVDAETNSLNCAIASSEKLQDVVALNVAPIEFDSLDLEQRNSAKSLVRSEPGPADTSPPPPPLAARMTEGLPPADAPAIALKSTNDPANSPAKEELPSSDPAEVPPPAAAQEMVANRTVNEELNGRLSATKQKRTSPPAIYGNSIEVDQGTEVFAELQQLQQQGFRNHIRAKETPLNSPSTAPSSKDTRKFSKDDVIAKLLNSESVRRSGLNNFDSKQSVQNSYRSRQRAVLVLRTQAPAPSTEAAPEEPSQPQQ